MPRDASGNYTLPTGNPVVTGTVIASEWANTTMADLAGEMTGSLSRNGAGGMLAPLLLDNGSAGSPGIAFTNEGTLGFYRPSAGNLDFVAGGSPQARIQATDQLQVYRNGAYRRVVCEGDNTVSGAAVLKAPDATYPNLVLPTADTNALALQGFAASNVPTLRVEGGAGQVGFLQQWLDSTDSPIASLSPTGLFNVHGTINILNGTPQLNFYDESGATQRGYLNFSATSGLLQHLVSGQALAVKTTNGPLELDSGSAAFTVDAAAGATFNLGAGAVVFNAVQMDLQGGDIYARESGNYAVVAGNGAVVANAPDSYLQVNHPNLVFTGTFAANTTVGAPLLLSSNTLLGLGTSGNEVWRVSGKKWLSVDALGLSNARHNVFYDGGATEWGYACRPALADTYALAVSNTVGTFVGGVYLDADNSTVTLVSGSSRRLKRNIQDFNGPRAATRIVRRIPVRRYEFKTDPTRQRVGFIADEVEPEFPQAVIPLGSADDQGALQGLSMEAMIPVIWRALQETDKRLLALETPP